MQVDALVPIVLWYEARSGGAVHNGIGQGWERIDLLLTDHAGALRQTQDGTRCLIDHAGLYDRLAAHRDWPGPDRARIAFLIDEFLRVLGLLPVVLGRRGYLAARAGLEMQRMALFQLLSEAVERADTGGMLAWSRRLPPDQLALLERLPQADLSEASLIEAYRAVASAFLPHARTSLGRPPSRRGPERICDDLWVSRSRCRADDVSTYRRSVISTYSWAGMRRLYTAAESTHVAAGPRPHNTPSCRRERGMPWRS
ncbi:hypothetical protein [Sphingomonas sp. CV7422]|uniref:hypothetical protein n=1 Tax=Sphingomonas sp. CV7422 TaxID=3018036 RepID=UPI0022FE7897|nr:hypothetical protein [Sphingomonas sp. CV7422]